MAILDELQSLDMDRMGDLPLPLKVFLIGLVSVIILFLGFWFINLPQLEQLQKDERALITLKEEFEMKQAKAASLQAYRDQLANMQVTFGQLLKKLPSQTEVPKLLEDISEAGVTSGLRFDLFKPQPEKAFSFYAELPVQVVVTGTYHQLANFIDKISSLDRIVTVDDFSIVKSGFVNMSKVRSSVSTLISNKNANAKGVDRSGISLLNMALVVKTYRYKQELPPLPKEQTKGKKGKATMKPAAKPKKKSVD